ncbi:hypothetical protein AYI69_g314 [Smittium culicis]|uniref:DMAP1-binding domain-containing protein n=1 Tax=Smittium culicis TaxID=133412 RepID=A0A1R1YTD6_9FUNG|nr:hypothetical protein AYI69_g314 [Smittium culicis]
MDYHEEFPELSDQYLSQLNDLIQEYQNGYLTEIGYGKKKLELTEKYNLQISQARSQNKSHSASSKIQPQNKPDTLFNNSSSAIIPIIHTSNSSSSIPTHEPETKAPNTPPKLQNAIHPPSNSNSILPNTSQTSPKSIPTQDLFQNHSDSQISIMLNNSTMPRIDSKGISLISPDSSPDIKFSKESFSPKSIDPSSQFDELVQKNPFEYLSDSSGDDYFVDNISVLKRSNSKVKSTHSIERTSSRKKSNKKNNPSNFSRVNSLLVPKRKSTIKKYSSSSKRITKDFAASKNMKNWSQINSILGNFNDDSDPSDLDEAKVSEFYGDIPSSRNFLNDQLFQSDHSISDSNSSYIKNSVEIPISQQLSSSNIASINPFPNTSANNISPLISPAQTKNSNSIESLIQKTNLMPTSIEIESQQPFSEKQEIYNKPISDPFDSNTHTTPPKNSLESINPHNIKPFNSFNHTKPPFQESILIKKDSDPPHKPEIIKNEKSISQDDKGFKNDKYIHLDDEDAISISGASSSSNDSLLLSEVSRNKYIQLLKSKNSFSSNTQSLQPSTLKTNNALNSPSHEFNTELFNPINPPSPSQQNIINPINQSKVYQDSYLISEPNDQFHSQKTHSNNVSPSKLSSTAVSNHNRNPSPTKSSNLDFSPDFAKLNIDFDFSDSFDKKNLTSDFGKFTISDNTPPSKFSSSTRKDSSLSLKHVNSFNKNTSSSTRGIESENSNNPLHSNLAQIHQHSPPHDLQIENQTKNSSPLLEEILSINLLEIQNSGDFKNTSARNSYSNKKLARRTYLSTRISTINSAYFPSDSAIESAPAFGDNNSNIKFNFENNQILSEITNSPGKELFTTSPNTPDNLDLPISRLSSSNKYQSSNPVNITPTNIISRFTDSQNQYIPKNKSSENEHINHNFAKNISINDESTGVKPIESSDLSTKKNFKNLELSQSASENINFSHNPFNDTAILKNYNNNAFSASSLQNNFNSNIVSPSPQQNIFNNISNSTSLYEQNIHSNDKTASDNASPLTQHQKISGFNSITSALYQRVISTPNSIAYTCVDNKSNEIGSLTWQQVYSCSLKISNTLKEHPHFIKKGDRVALVFRKYEILDYVCSLFGCFISGIVAVPLVSCDSYIELAYVLRSTGTKLVLTSDLNLKSLNKDLEMLLPKTSQYTQNDFANGSNPNDFSSIWPREITWVSTDNVSNINENSPNTSLPSFYKSDLLEDDLAYIEFSKSGNGELKGVSITHSALIKQCAVWILSTGVPGKNSAPSVISGSTNLNDLKNNFSKNLYHDSPYPNNSGHHDVENSQNHSVDKPPVNNARNNDGTNSPQSKSFLNRFTSSSGLKMGKINKKIGGNSNNYVKIERPLASPSRPSSNSPSIFSSKGYKKKTESIKRANSEQNSTNEHSNSSINNIASNVLPLDSDSDEDYNQNFINSERFSRFNFNHYDKDTILINSEPRQQFGLVLGILSVALSGNHTIFLSTAVCENPGAYLNAISKYKASIVVTSGYTEIQNMLDVVIKDPSKVLSKKTINGMPNLPNLSNLRLFLVDTLEIDHDFHLKFSSAVLMLFGCPVRKILQEFNRSVLVPIVTLPEYGGFLLSMDLGEVDDLIDFDASSSNLSNNSMSRIYNRPKINSKHPIGSYDFDRDVSGINMVFLDRDALNHNKVHQNYDNKSKLINKSKSSQASLEKKFSNFAKLSLFGPPSLNSSIAIVDPDTRFVCDFNEVGEIWVESSCTGSGFWGLPKLSKSTFSAKFDCYQSVDNELDSFLEPASPRNLKLGKSEKSYLRTGLMGFTVNKKLMVLGYYEDRLRCLTKKKISNNQLVPDVSIHYSVEIGYSLKRKFKEVINDCLLMEILSNNVHLIVILIESDYIYNKNPSSSSLVDWSDLISSYLRDNFNLFSFCISFCKPNTLPRAYQYGQRQINSLLSRRMWELGKVNTFFTNLDFSSLFLGLPNDIPDYKYEFDSDPSELIFGKWSQITGYEQLSECQDSQINLDLLHVDSITELLVIRAKYFPKDLAYAQYNSKGARIASVCYQELLYRISFLCIFLLDKLRVKAGDYLLVSITSSIEYIIAIHACIAIGVIPIPINPILNESNLIEDIPLIISAINHFKIKSILVNSLQGGNCLLNNKTAQSLLFPLSVVICDLAKTELGPKSGFGFNLGLGIGGSNNNSANNPYGNNQNDSNNLSSKNSEFGPVPLLILGQGTFKPYKDLTKNSNRIAIVMMYNGTFMAKPSFVSVTHQVVISFCAQQRIDFQLNYKYPIISSVRCYSGYGLLQMLAFGIFNNCPSIIYPPPDFYNNPVLWLHLVSSLKIKDAFATAPMLEHLICSLALSDTKRKSSNHSSRTPQQPGNRISFSPISNNNSLYDGPRSRLSRLVTASKPESLYGNNSNSNNIRLNESQINLENVANLILATEERIDCQLVNRIKHSLSKFNLGIDCFNPLYGSPMNMCISSRAYLGLNQLVLNLDIFAMQNKKVVLLPFTKTLLDSDPTNDLSATTSSPSAAHTTNNNSNIDKTPNAKNNSPTAINSISDDQNSLLLQDSGKVSGSTMVAIVDPETKRISDVGSIGEIWVYSDCNSLFIEEASPITNQNYFQAIDKQNRKSVSSELAAAKSNLLKNLTNLNNDTFNANFTSSKKCTVSKLNTDDSSIKDLEFVCTGDYGFLHLDVANHSMFKGKQIFNKNMNSPLQESRFDSSNKTFSLPRTQQLNSTMSPELNHQKFDENIEKEPFLFVVGKFDECFHHNNMLHFYSDIESTIAGCTNYETELIDECAVIQTNCLYDSGHPSYYNTQKNKFEIDSINPDYKNAKIVIIISVGHELQEFFEKYIEAALAASKNNSSSKNAAAIQYSQNQNSILKSIRQNWLPNSNNNANSINSLYPIVSNAFDQENLLGNLVANIIAAVLDRNKLKVDQVIVVKKDTIPKKKLKLVGRRQLFILDLFYQKKLTVLANYLT